MAELNTLQIDTGAEPKHSIIWLHGLGANGYDFEPVVPEFTFAKNTPVRFIFPHAPELPVTINGGIVMPAWYDILALDIDRKVDVEQLRKSAKLVAELVNAEITRGVPSENILIGGFSQGGAVAYELALSYPQSLGGLFALSSYFASADSINLSDANRNLPIFVAHGCFDPVVTEDLGQLAVKKLQEKGYQPEYHSYGIDHSLCLEEIRDMDVFFAEWLADNIKNGK